MANVKEYPPPRVSVQLRSTEFLWQKFSAFFSAMISLRKFPSSPQRMLLIPGTGNGERGTGNGERGTGNGERGTGNGSLGTSVQR